MRKTLFKLSAVALLVGVLAAPWAWSQGVTPGAIIEAVQKGVWSVTQSGAWNVGQSGTWTVQPGNTANTTAWLVTGTGGTFPATQSGTWTVQPGNTANTTPWLTKAAPTQEVSATLQNAAVANGNGSPLSVAGMASAVLTVDCDTCSGGTAIEFQGTEDGSKWGSLAAERLDGSARGTSTTDAGVTQWRVSTAGLQSIRAPVSSYSAGTVTVTARAVPLDNTLGILSGLASNITVQPGNTANTVPWLVKPHDGSSALFSASAAPGTGQANPTTTAIRSFNMCPDEGSSPLTWSPCVNPLVVAREITVADVDGAQTNASLVGTINSTTAVVVLRLSVTMDASNSGTVGCRIGFGAASIPAASLSGVNGVLLPRVELNAREGIVLTAGGLPIGKGAADEELRMTCDDPVGGNIYIGLTYYTVPA